MQGKGRWRSVTCSWRGLAGCFAASQLSSRAVPPADGVAPLCPPAAPQRPSHRLPRAFPQLRQRHKTGAESPSQRPARLGISAGRGSLCSPGPPSQRCSITRCGWDAGGSEQAVRPRGLRLVRSPEQDQAARTAPSITPTAVGGSAGRLALTSSHPPHRQSNWPSAKRSFCLPPPSPASRFLTKCFCRINHIYKTFPPAPFTVSLPTSWLGDVRGAVNSQFTARRWGSLAQLPPASQRGRWRRLRCSRFCF